VDEVEPDDQVVVLHRGRVLSRGAADELLRDTGGKTVHEAFSRLTSGEGAGE
jgi:ABC-2 type transport system ATP-binding protein